MRILSERRGGEVRLPSGLERTIMHDQWEYKLLTGHGLRQTLRDAEGVAYGRMSQELLNRLGQDGWEVCGHSLSFVSPRIVILKRKMTSA